jgi:hypothetical protein
MYVQLFPIYGIMFGVNYWNSKMDGDEGSIEVEHLFQIIIGIIGISFHYWKED